MTTCMCVTHEEMHHWMSAEDNVVVLYRTTQRGNCPDSICVCQSSSSVSQCEDKARTEHPLTCHTTNFKPSLELNTHQANAGTTAAAATATATACHSSSRPPQRAARMADAPLNNSWPSFSKLWMKRWSFKRASECKPYSGHPIGQTSGHSSGQQRVQHHAPAGTSSPSPSPPSLSEVFFFGGTNEDQDACSVVSESEVRGVEVSSSMEDLQGLSSSFGDSDCFRDLEVVLDGPLKTSPELTSQTAAPHLTEQLSSEEAPGTLVVTQLSPKLLPSCVIDSDDSLGLGVGLSVTSDVHGMLGSMERSQTKTESRDHGNTVHFNGDVEVDSFPNFARSMSTSRRHSWGVPVAPINLGRRLSLDTMAMDSDGDEDETGHRGLFQPTQRKTDRCTACPLDETDGPKGRLSCPAAKPDGVPGKQVYSRSEILATDEYSRAAHISRIVRTSKQAARAAGAEEFDPEEHLHSNEGQSHIAKQTNNKANDKDSESVTWYEFLSNENEEEDDRSEKVEKGTKVKRTLSSLRNRMTGSFSKDKGKNREKQQQRGKEKEREAKETEFSHNNVHLFALCTFSSCATCSLCGKTLQKKHSLQCMNCAVNVHRSCKSLLGECTSTKNKRDSLSRTGPSGSPILALKDRHREQEQSGTASSQTPNGHAIFLGPPGMTIIPRGPSNHLIATHNITSPGASALYLGHSLRHHSSSGSLPGEMDETDTLRFKRCTEDTISLVPSTTESIIVEDAHYAAVRADLESDAQDLEVESWSLAVDQQFVKRHSKEAIKRQDVIYELMQTEMHHVRTLKIMLRVYIRELKENLQMDSCRLECLFPRLENLLELHMHFLSQLKERRRENIVSPTDGNYTVDRIADLLIAQFSGDVGEKMKDSYGDFCSRHTEAVSYYKEQMQTNKRFHSIIRKINNLSIVRRLGVPECILLVTQRITKYPAFVERILHSTKVGTEEHTKLNHALGLIKDTIVQVDSLVHLHEKTCRLRDIHNKMEPKALGKIKDGRVFRREDLAQGRRCLLHEGTVNWKAASGRLKDILAVLLSDVLLLLQEKDQRYVFAAVDNKPSVISLQKLIVREVAHAEKAMFLICASSNEPEMYEIHTTSKEERNTWMAHIRQAVESCPHTEGRLFSEEEEEARASRLKEFQERLSQKDAAIVQTLSEKLQLFADMAESVAGLEDTASRSKLLLRGNASDLQQGEALLKEAITEVENLQNLLQSGVRDEVLSSQQDEGSSSGLLPRRADTFGGYDSSPTILTKNGNVKNFSGESRNRERSQRASSDPQLQDLCGSQALEQTVDESCCTPTRWNRIWSNSFPEAEFFDKVLKLSQRLYSLQAIISQQDSQIELQRISLTERASLPGRHRGNVLLEQEKQRTLALQREELASFHKLQSQHRQEQQRWEKERGKHRQQVEATEARLREREEECKRVEEQLAEERVELERQRETYQQDLERLRESTRAVEKEKERLEHQKKIKRKTIEVAPMTGSLNGELLLSSGLSSTTSLCDTPLPPKSLVRGSMSVSPADYTERPEVTLRRDASSSTLPLKTEVPLHLFSTTNQQHKLVGVQQQIPTKLAALSSGKGKGVKSGKASQRTDSTASVDMKQIFPLKLSARDDNALKAKRSVSPHHQTPLSASPLPPSLHHHGDHQQSPLDTSGPDFQSTIVSVTHPAMIHKPPVPPAQPSLQPPAIPAHSQNTTSLQLPAQVQPQGFGPNPHVHVQGLGHSHSVPLPPPYNINTEDLSKEDVIFF
ncbi:rho guanine nucleotide exchange factor 18 isoform X3 [Phyllopteryx taeniolatus]|uniref:rho guanine nucleotide exchange factor 18 isoform X3 n=1 Tax=Phyllopteryx taeniolatus TaxID=161469 RepID=UPI002AD2D122|nr:rho guanine nucleotide exchange factor 18 isoform X3 [Phyllopteryx taeniolatus]